MGIVDRFKSVWNAFRNEEERPSYMQDVGSSTFTRPDRQRLLRTNERTIVSSIVTQIAIDVSSVDIRHVIVDAEGRYERDVLDGLSECLRVEANIDQTGRTFIQDVVSRLLNDGVVVILPVDTTSDPTTSQTYDIRSWRTASVVDWYPRHIRANVYNDRTGLHQDILFPKSSAAIITNPLYSVMNEPNSTLSRLASKLHMLDAVDRLSSSGKLDLIIQLPYVVKSDLRRKEATSRAAAIADQLANSEYGIAYTDGTEKITQLNRPVENTLFGQVTYLTEQLYNQLGMTAAVFNGTADERALLNYHNKTIAPILATITEEMTRTFLTKTARTQGHRVIAIRDPFKLVPVEDLAEIADKFTRNEILSPNEIRAIIGLRPNSDPKSDELRNRNLNEQAPIGTGENNGSDAKLQRLRNEE